MAAEKVSITTTVTTDGGSATSTDGSTFVIRVPVPYKYYILCDECEKMSRIRDEHNSHMWDCPSYKIYIKRKGPDREKNPNTCETCNDHPPFDGFECRHFKHPDFEEITVDAGPGDDGSWPSVHFTTKTTSVDELLPLMETAAEWVATHAYKLVAESTR